MTGTLGNRCRVCGCHDLQACATRCHWVAEDLCSACDPYDLTEALMALLAALWALLMTAARTLTRLTRGARP